MKLPSSFGGQMVLFAVCCGLAYLAWPSVKGMFPDSFPLEQRDGRERFDQYGYKGDPTRFDRWSQGGRGGSSDFYPGPHRQRPERQEQDAPDPHGYAGPLHVGPWRTNMHLDPDIQPDMTHVEDRRGERRYPDLSADAGGGDIGRGPPGGGYGAELRCRDKQTRRDVPLSFCERSGAPPPGGR